MKKTAVLLILVLVVIIPAVSSLRQTAYRKECSALLNKAIASVNSAIELHYALENTNVHDYVSAEDLVENLFKKRMDIKNEDDIISLNPVMESLCSRGEEDILAWELKNDITFCITNFHNDNSAKKGSICDSYNTVACSNENTNLYIDINGGKGPNMLTTNPDEPKDIYTAKIYASKAGPSGNAARKIMYGH